MTENPQYKRVDLTTINNGAAVELFKEEFDKVLRNINDISVESDAVREITLKFKIKPTKDRSSATTTIQSSSKLVSIKEHEASVFLANRNNAIEAFVTNPNQMDFNFENKPKIQE